MCINSTSLIPCSPLCARPSRRHNLRLGRISRRRRSLKETKEKKQMRVVKKTEMEIKNLKLYMENRSIIKENEKLRQKALLLHRENQALFFQLQQKKLPQQKQSLI